VCDRHGPGKVMNGRKGRDNKDPKGL